ncbi:hypothetical protein [Streptomyces sp. NPDC049879]|uniref:hypothetical protein n=1 Tax=Streptomyces sp. NPDC049879 TaxID=3365598 RepID=UPI0037AA40E2
MYTVPPAGLPAAPAAAPPPLPVRYPGVAYARARAAEDAAVRAGAQWDGWFTVRGQVHPSQRAAAS